MVGTEKLRSQTSIRRARKALALVWFIGASFLFFIFLLQTIFGRYGDRNEEAWAWLLPMDSTSQSIEQKLIDRFLARLAIGLSIAYLATVSLTILLSPWAQLHANLGPLQLMQTSQLWLAPFQGLVLAILGAFFVKKSSQ